MKKSVQKIRHNILALILIISSQVFFNSIVLADHTDIDGLAPTATPPPAPAASVPALGTDGSLLNLDAHKNVKLQDQIDPQIWADFVESQGGFPTDNTTFNFETELNKLIDHSAFPLSLNPAGTGTPNCLSVSPDPVPTGGSAPAPTSATPTAEPEATDAAAKAKAEADAKAAAEAKAEADKAAADDKAEILAEAEHVLEYSPNLTYDEEIELKALLKKVREGTLNTNFLLARLKEMNDTPASTDSATNDKTALELKETALKLEKQTKDLAETTQSLAAALAAIAQNNANGTAAKDPVEEQKNAAKATIKEVRGVVIAALDSNSQAITGVLTIIAQNDSELAALNKAGLGGSRRANQLRANSAAWEKTKLALQSERAEILVSKRDLDYEFKKVYRGPQTGLLSLFAPGIAIAQYQQSLNSTEYNLEKIRNNLEYSLAYTGGEGGVNSAVAKALEAGNNANSASLLTDTRVNRNPVPTAYDAGGSFRTNSLFVPDPRPPKFIRGFSEPT